MFLLYADDPCASTPCANNGNCTAIGPLNYTCECTPGYTGPNCSKEIDGCLTKLCPNNSTCVNGSKCICHPGFQLNGEMCVELPTDTSNQPPGMCLSYACECPCMYPCTYMDLRFQVMLSLYGILLVLIKMFPMTLYSHTSLTRSPFSSGSVCMTFCP